MPETVPWRIRKDHCALIVIDMQNDFLKPRGVLYYNDKPLEALDNILRLTEYCRAEKLPVLYTKTQLTDGFLISPLEVSYQPSLISNGLREGTWGFELIDEITPRQDEFVIVKHRYDAFYNTNLEVLLRNINRGKIDTLIITGTVTNVCCESTARAAFMRDFKVLFPGDANGATDHTAHLATLDNIGKFFGRVLTTDELISRLTSGEEDKPSILAEESN